MRRMMRDKRGIAEEISDTAFALLVLFLGILAMTSMSTVNKDNRAASSSFFINQAIFENDIGVYLKAPVSIDGQQMTMADFIVLAADTDSSRYTKLWKQQTNAFFSSVKVDFEGFFVEVRIKGEPTPVMTTMENTEYQVVDYSSKTYLPSYSGRLIIVGAFQNIRSLTTAERIRKTSFQYTGS